MKVFPHVLAKYTQPATSRTLTYFCCGCRDANNVMAGSESATEAEDINMEIIAVEWQ